MSDRILGELPSVKVTHGNITAESNTATEAQIRTVLGAPTIEVASESTTSTATAGRAPVPATASAAQPVTPAQAEDGDGEPSETELDQLGLRQRNADGTYRPVKAKKRIQELLGKHRVSEAQRTAAETELTKLRAELDVARRTAPITTEPPTRTQASPSTSQPGAFPKPKPVLADYAETPDPYAALAEGLTDWKFEQHEHTRQQQVVAQQARIDADLSDRARRDLLAGHATRLADARQAHADFDAVIAAVEIPPHRDPTWQAHFDASVAASEDSGELLYELATHPDELRQLHTLPIGRIGSALGRLEERLAQRRSAAVGSARPAPVSTARPPIRPVRGGPTSSEEAVDEATLSVSELMKRQSDKLDAKFRNRHAQAGRV